MSLLQMMEVMCYTFHSMIPTEEQLKEKHEERVAKLRQQYRDSMKLPRKKKKAVRKMLNKEYSMEVAMYKWSLKTTLNTFKL